MQVVILAAGKGERFTQAGYTVPKPLILVNGKPMITYAMEQAAVVDAAPIILCPEALRHDIWRAAAKEILPTVIGVRHVQCGAAMTLLAAASALNEDEPVMVMDCDSVINHEELRHFKNWSQKTFLSRAADSTLLAFYPTDDSSRYSFVKLLGGSDVVEEVVEKVRISKLATCGVHCFRSWSLLRTSLCLTVTGYTTNDEYYLAPVHNYVSRTLAFAVQQDGFTAIGTPEQLEAYEQAISKN
jgi:NDP-sugar pyrophosphorylase family protein